MSDAVITRSPGVVVGGYVVGGGQYGQTKELDSNIQKAAQFIADALGCNVVIRFNSGNRSGGAYVMDTHEEGMVGNCSIGINGVLTWSDCFGNGAFDQSAVDRFHEHMTNGDPYDTMLFYAYIDLRHLDSPYIYQRSVLYCEESPRYTSVKEACAWVKQKAEENAAVKEYLSRCREFKAGRLGNAYGKTVYARLAGKVDARKRFLAGEDIYMLPNALDPNALCVDSLRNPYLARPSLIERETMKPGNEVAHFNRQIDSYKGRWCNRYNGQNVAYYVATYTYA